MSQKALVFTFVLSGLLLANLQARSTSSAEPSERPRVAVVLPLFLDSLFKGGAYRYGNSIPKWSMPALEFYHGLRLAADSLTREGVEADIWVIDSRKNGGYEAAFADPTLKTANLIIAMAQGSPELKALAEIALAHNIPLINATYPSDGRVTGNNRMVILNSTLKTHCEGLYRNLQINHSTDNLVLITRTGTVENFLKASMEEAGKNTRSVALKWTEQVLPDAFTPEQLVALLDSTRTNTIIGATLDKNFSLRLIKTIAGMSAKYRVNIMGMPTWDEYALNKAEFKGSTVYFSTPFVSYSANAALYNAFNKRFTNILKSKPSDMAYKGYEIVYRYTRTLKDYPTPEAFMENINKPAYRMFADFNVQPVTAADGTVNYLENKKIYWVKKVDGNIVWVGN